MPLFIPYNSYGFTPVFRKAGAVDMALFEKFISISSNSYIAELGSFTISSDVNSKVLSLVNRNTFCSALFTYQKDELKDSFLLQKYIEGKEGYSSIISRTFKIDRSVMFEITENDQKRIEVDHTDSFQIEKNGKIKP